MNSLVSTIGFLHKIVHFVIDLAFYTVSFTALIVLSTKEKNNIRLKMQNNGFEDSTINFSFIILTIIAVVFVSIGFFGMVEFTSNN